MTPIAEQQFLSWAASSGVVPDARYDPPHCLVYQGDRRESRFWEIPRAADRMLPFLSRLLSGFEPWRHCDVWPRGGCCQNPDPPHSRIEEARALAFYGGHVPDGLCGAVLYAAVESDQLINLIAARARTAWCVTDDLFVVPDHAAQFLYVDHHDVVHVECVDSERMERFIRHMAGGGYELPEHLPDATFKRPAWMT